MKKMRLKIVKNNKSIIEEDKQSEDFISELSIEVQNDIFMLFNSNMEWLVNSYNYTEGYNGEHLLDIHLPINLDDYKYKFTNYIEFFDYMKKRRLTFHITYSKDEAPNLAKIYQQPNGKLHIDYNLSNDYIELFIIGDIEKLYKSLIADINPISKALVHEITHAYDTFISNYDFKNDKVKDKYVNLIGVNKKGNAEYRYSFERNAYYSDTKELLKNIVKSTTLKEYVDMFVKYYPKFEILNKQEKQRIINRAYDEWYAENE